jgi:hypothetical protein
MMRADADDSLISMMFAVPDAATTPPVSAMDEGISDG